MGVFSMRSNFDSNFFPIEIICNLWPCHQTRHYSVAIFAHRSEKFGSTLFSPPGPSVTVRGEALIERQWRQVAHVPAAQEPIELPGCAQAVKHQQG